ncbi:MAG: 4Fe-4S binding protein [Spirochaetales bacterium]|nr:4Fe-4S binding protein [Spirochaetales bacterium]
MKIVVASGKGGTGKTFFSLNLARIIDRELLLLDCDVEEPNANLLLKGEKISQRDSNLLVPKVNLDLCDGCRVCADFCQFNAIAVIRGTPLIFDDLCHGCGGCVLFCPQKAMYEEPHKIGEITHYKSGKVTLIEGRLDVGKALAVPVIRDVKADPEVEKHPLVLIDAPPGTSCPVVWSLSGCDLAILVTEGTPFGMHDLKLAVETVREVGIPCGVVINRDGLGDDRVVKYCQQEGIPIVGKIPNDRKIATLYAKGKILVDVTTNYRPLFAKIWREIESLAAKVGGVNAKAK